MDCSLFFELIVLWVILSAKFVPEGQGGISCHFLDWSFMCIHNQEAVDKLIRLIIVILMLLYH